MVNVRDDFFERYAFGTISSPTDLTTTDLVDWFTDNSIVAGLWTLDDKNFEFIVPINPNDYEFVYTVDKNGEIDDSLLIEQLAVLIAKRFSVDVTINESAILKADWSDQKDTVETKDKPAYVISSATPESAMQTAHSMRQSIEYGSVGKLSVWRFTEPAGWFEYTLMPYELPMYVFDEGSIAIRNKIMREPIQLRREGALLLSMSDDAHHPMKSKPVAKMLEEIKNYRLRPGGDIDGLISSGTIKKPQVESLVRAIELSDSDNEFIHGVGKVFDIPDVALDHITHGTMPENTRIVKVSSWWKLFAKSMEEYSYEPDPNAGPMKRFYAYVSGRPLVDWAFMTAEVVIGAVIVYSTLTNGELNEMMWWHYVLIVIGALLISEGVTGMVIRLRRSLK